MALQRRQVAAPDNLTGSDDADPQFVVISVAHCNLLALASRWETHLTTVTDCCSTTKIGRSELQVICNLCVMPVSLFHRRPTRIWMKESLDRPADRRQLTHLPARLMSKVCSITGSKPTRGSIIHRRGMAKKKGGVGRHVTKNVPRTFSPNLHEHRIWVAELKKFVRVKVSARGLKTINKNGAYAALKKAGLIAA